MSAVLLAACLTAVGAPGSAQEGEASGFDRVWGSARLYEGDTDSFVQSFDLSGRLQLDFAYVDNGDDHHGEFNVRRFRFGFKTRFARKFTLHVEADFNPQEADPFYVRLTDTYLAWEPSPAAEVILGKQSAGFTLDGMTSSKRLLTIDRNNLTNNIWFTEEYIPGASVGGEATGLVYFAGIFTSDADDPEFGDFKGGEVFYLATLGRDFASGSGADKTLVRLNLVYNEPGSDSTVSRQLKGIASLNLSWERGEWGLRVDLSAADGYGDQSNLVGFVVMPFLELSEKLQLVGRYTLVDSEDDNGVRFARYERSIAGSRGDRYNEFYLGLNYYWYGHKLKLQNGAQYVDMRDRAADGGAYTGWAWTTALRLSW